ncbi:MAG: 50S ribosomal protein L24 [uncultured bacterium]|uniref:Large ribosomal subunit protein uL24 n=2 Tax=Candidatus Wolfeibacteriota TaxID=1752735 RepID=A0A0G1H7F7_9BACT|nr:MAG: 50S ribosomal protein L24 [uncultured bacterium]KKR13050.1 MAG: Ribosomal protein L24 [Candidatus Wolfebacteria bacterium GW2011_GWC2_39_22]KKT42720.1 MAG: Ribosomal protein L24 [Candidatus Wolfebacteria bacterium GW2011_GWE2_44_13]HBI26075.1 50S ribosomal protein L24 [Candidatus Wolfebacteria bacterium]
MRIKKGDTVKIMQGKEKGNTGKVLSIMPLKGRILVEGLNLYKKNVKPKKQGEKGQIVTIPRSLNASNAMLVCPACGKATRVGVAVENDKKVRVCKKCKARIS